MSKPTNYRKQLEENYNQWRKISWSDIEAKLEMLQNIDKIANYIDDVQFVIYYQIRIAYSFPFEQSGFAEKYFLKVLKRIESEADKSDMLETTYEGLGDLYFETKQYGKAGSTYLKLLKIKPIDDFVEEDLLRIATAMVKSEPSFYQKAEELLLFVYQSEYCNEEMNHKMTTKTNYYLGLAKYKLKKYGESKSYFEKALVLYKQRKWDNKKILQYLNQIADAIENKPTSA